MNRKKEIDSHKAGVAPRFLLGGGKPTQGKGDVTGEPAKGCPLELTTKSKRKKQTLLFREEKKVTERS